jgi:hypothetical protein
MSTLFWFNLIFGDSLFKNRQLTPSNLYLLTTEKVLLFLLAYIHTCNVSSKWPARENKQDYLLFKRLPGLGSEPGIFWFHLFSHSITLPLSHSGSPRLPTFSRGPFYKRKQCAHLLFNHVLGSEPATFQYFTHCLSKVTSFSIINPFWGE